MTKTWPQLIGIAWLLLAFPYCLAAQNVSPKVISTAGQSQQNDAIQLDWTLGEIAVSTLNDANLVLSQGFHQVYLKITSIHSISKEIGLIKVFPNPTIHQIRMQLELTESQKLEVLLFDAHGKKLWRDRIEGKSIQLEKDLGNHPPGIYFLQFKSKAQNFSKSFKIQKIK